MRVKMSKQPPPAPTASAVGPCPTEIQIVGRPDTGSLPSTIAPPDHPTYCLYLIAMGNDLESYGTLNCVSHFGLGLACQAKGQCCHTKKINPCQNIYGKKRVKVRSCHYATTKRPVKITMYLGLDIIIKLKFTTIFDRCAILNVLNYVYLTKNFES